MTRLAAVVVLLAVVAGCKPLPNRGCVVEPSRQLGRLVECRP